jgi:hypothetical protein
MRDTTERRIRRYNKFRRRLAALFILAGLGAVLLSLHSGDERLLAVAYAFELVGGLLSLK